LERAQIILAWKKSALNADFKAMPNLGSELATPGRKIVIGPKTALGDFWQGLSLPRRQQGKRLSSSFFQEFASIGGTSPSAMLVSILR
jgi:hypothetical protein